jgi:hypothetical protein
MKLERFIYKLTNDSFSIDGYIGKKVMGATCNYVYTFINKEIVEMKERELEDKIEVSTFITIKPISILELPILLVKYA